LTHSDGVGFHTGQQSEIQIDNLEKPATHPKSKGLSLLPTFSRLPAWDAVNVVFTIMGGRSQWILRSCVITIFLSQSLLSNASTSQPPSPSSGISDDGSHAAMLGRVEASIMGESALIDRETGRVYWEGGSSNTLYESLAPKLDQYGAEHVKAALLTGLITLAFIGILAGWMRRAIEQADLNHPSSRWLVVSMMFTVLEWTILRLPKLENKWLVLASVALYFLESYNCSTRRFLANAISSTTELEEYIESLRREQPVVQWKARSFHYEKRKIFALASVFRSLLRKSKQQVTDLDHGLIPRTRNSAPIFPFTKRVLTHEATATYQYER
jgi:hypothetical protein